MKKSRWAKLSAAALCVLLLLTACVGGNNGGNSSGGENTPGESDPSDGASDPGVEVQYTLEEIWANNQVEAVLQNRRAMSYLQEFYTGGEDTPAGTIAGQYYRVDGYLHMDMIYHEVFGDTYTEAYADAEMPGAYYNVVETDRYMFLYPSADYEHFQTALWFDKPMEDIDETLVSCSMQDDLVVVTTVTTYPYGPDNYDRTVYYLEPTFGHLIYKESTSYLLEEGRSIPDVPYGEDDNAVINVTKTTVTYDDPWSFEGPAPHEAVTGESADSCQITLIEDYGTDDARIYTFPVAHGTYVYFYSDNGGYAIYSDAGLTMEISPYGEIDISGDALTLYVVRQ